MSELALGGELYFRIPATLYFPLDKIAYRFLAMQLVMISRFLQGYPPQESGNLLICMARRPR